MNRRGRLVVLSGPSGGGKSTVVARSLAAGDLPVRLAVSATTRKPRPGEQDGVHYHFWSRDRFDQGTENQEFLEWAEVHGNRYGTLRSEVSRHLEAGCHVLLEIDVQGARQIKREFPDALLVFLSTSSLEAYEQRLRGRNTEDEAAIERRLVAAKRELAAASEYDREIINDDLDAAVQAFRALLKSL